MVLAVSISLPMELSCGPVVWTTLCVYGTCVKDASYNSTILHLRSSHWATVRRESGSLLGMFHAGVCFFVVEATLTTCTVISDSTAKVAFLGSVRLCVCLSTHDS